MQRLKPYTGIIALAFGLVVLTGIIAFTDPKAELILGAPSTQLTYEKTLIPVADSLYDLGTSTQTWRNAYLDQLCLSGDCKSAWPAEGAGGSFPFTATGYGNSTSTTLGFLNGFLSVGSSTITGNATTSGMQSVGSLFINGERFTDLTGTALTNSAGALTVDTSGTWSGNAGTASALASDPTDCSAGSFTIGINAAGTAQGCTDAWTEAENTAAAYAAQATTLTVAGTANQISSSAGAQSLAANRTWTLSLPNHVIFPSSFQATQASTTNATTTNFHITGLSSEVLSVDANGRVYATTTGLVSAGAGIGFDNATRRVVGGALTITNTGVTSASAGNGISVSANTGSVTITNSIGYPFPDNATTTLLTFSGGLISTGSTTLNGNATTTGMHGVGSLFINSERFTDLTGAGLTLSSGALTVDNVTAAMLNAEDFGNFTCNGTTCTIDNTSVTNAMLANSTISGIALGNNLGDLTATNSTLTFSGTYNGSTARTIGLNLANANSWSALQTFANASTTLFSTSYASSTVWRGGGLTTDCDTAATSKLLWDLTTGQFSCGTDQTGAGGSFPFTPTTSFGSAANSTSTLMLLTNGLSASSTVRFGNVGITGQLVWDSTFPGRLTVTNASTTNLNVSAILVTPYSAATTLAQNGQFYIDSTSGQVKYRTGDADRVLGDGFFYPAFSYSTSTAWTGTTTIPLGTAFVGETWSGVQCFTDTGTLQVSFNDGTNRMNFINASTTVGTVTLTTNNTFTAAEKRYVDVGTPASSPKKIACTVRKALTSD